MVEIKHKLKIVRGTYKIEIKGQLELPFEMRQKSRFKATLVSGEEVGVMLPRGEILRGGDLVTASDGRIIEVVAQPESVLHVEGATPAALAKIAYHLGNRHVPVEVGDGYLRLGDDHVLERMLEGLGAKVSRTMAPFEPEAGAYGGAGHEHGAAKIHDHHHDDTHTITTIAAMTTNTNLVRLLQLASPTLPVGAYSYSQGLEAAIEAGVVTRCRECRAVDRRSTRVLDVAHGSAAALSHDQQPFRHRSTERRCSLQTARLQSCGPRPCRWDIRLNRLLPSLDVDAAHVRRAVVPAQHLQPPSMHGRSTRRKRCRRTSGRGSKTR